MTITAPYGTFLKPFSEDSPWNIFPINPKLGTYELPASIAGYSPVIESGKFSTGIFLGKPTDPPMVVHPVSGQSSIWEPNTAKNYPTFTIPHWPADTKPATGSDGHADIVDEESGVIHSFWQLRNENGKWCAAQYAWSTIDGKGWGDSSHFYQGARAAGVPTMAGLIRKHEVDDGDTVYRHALAMSLPYEALSGGYVYPATSADNDAATTNKGQIPEGALLMLPADYDSRTIVNPKLKKVVETLKTYGAYVVDRNSATPFFIYVEEGASGSVWAGYSYTQEFKELNKIRASLRQVIAADAWVTYRTAESPLKSPVGGNLLSLRGPWKPRSGTETAIYDMYKDSLEFPATKNVIIMENFESLGLSKVEWAALKSGDRVRFYVESEAGGLGRIQVFRGDGRMMFDGPVLFHKEGCEFTVPWGMTFKLFASNQKSNGAACSVKMGMVKL